MSESLFSIGQFARVGDLPASVLRYYDEVGLLPAAHVDAVTGYRFYDATQQSQARLLARLREADVPIDVMRRLVGLRDASLAAALEGVAAEQLRAAGQRAAVLRELAAEAVRPAARDCRVVVEPALLVDGLSRVIPLLGAAPFDAVLLSVAPTVLTLLGTDRYRLAMLRCPVAPSSPEAHAGDVPVRLLLGRDEAERLTVLLNRTETMVEVRARPDGLQVGDDTFATREDAAFPDLIALDSEFALQLRGRRLLTPDQFDSDADEVVLDVGGLEVHLTPELAREAVGTLVGPRVLVEVTSSVGPVVLSSPSRPDHRVAIMPRRP